MSILTLAGQCDSDGTWARLLNLLQLFYARGHVGD